MMRSEMQWFVPSGGQEEDDVESDNETVIRDDDKYQKLDYNVGLSKAEQRRSNKPIMEKRRRARINSCLNELKSLILDAMKKDPARHSKLEKADILEMTVKHLQNVQRQQLAVAVATDPSVLQKFKSGFGECASEVSRYVSRIEGVDPAVKQRLVNHLSSCVSSLQHMNPLMFSAMASPSLGLSMAGLPVVPGGGSLPSVINQMPFPAGDVNNNHARLMNNLQLVSGRLQTGELALLLPGSGQFPFPFLPPVGSGATNGPSSTVTSGSIERERTSAFSAVRPKSPPRPKTPPSPVSVASSGSVSSSGSLNSPTTPKTPSVFLPDTRQPVPSHTFKFPESKDSPSRKDSFEKFQSTFPYYKSKDETEGTIYGSRMPASEPPRRDPLDFSIKKHRPDSIQPPVKRPVSDIEYSSRKEPRLAEVEGHHRPKVQKVEPMRQEKTCGAEDLSKPSTSDDRDDMWRPW